MKNYNFYPRYLIPIFIIGCFLFCYFCFFVKSPVTTIILTRHAERTGTVDALNSAGTIRAQELSRILDEINVSAIYASTALRTQQTATPIATQLGININTYNTSNLSALVNEIKSTHKGKIVLVVGHSNTVPQTINLLGVIPSLTDIPHDEYDNLYIVTLHDKSYTRLLKMEYGADTP